VRSCGYSDGSCTLRGLIIYTLFPISTSESISALYDDSERVTFDACAIIIRP
jgi:hypothetical protein